jgi:5-oxoprolinase (ATP-hydrolysing) subunit A
MAALPQRPEKLKARPHLQRCAARSAGAQQRRTGVARQVNLNADMGEGWGAYEIGHDAALLTIIKSANVACGFHAGDWNTMADVTRTAVANGVSVGAHPGFNDLWGFGRRRIDMRPQDVEYMVAYQIGALQAMAAYANAVVTHVKPHGALNNMAADNEDYAMAIGRAIKTVDASLIYVALSGSQMHKAGERLGLRVACEGFCDRLYEDDGNLMSRHRPDAVIKDPVQARTQVVEMVLNQHIVSASGNRIARRIDTLCIHGDEPTSLVVAEAVRDGLKEAGVEIVPLTKMSLS